MTMTHRRTGLFFVVLAACGYAVLPIITRSIYFYSDLTPTDIGIWRFIFATPAIWLWIKFQDYRKGEKSPSSGMNIAKTLFLGGLYAGSALAAFFGLSYIPASTFVVLFYTYPAMVALMALVLGTKLRKTAWVALALTLIGVVLTVPNLSFAGENTVLGIALALLNAFLVAFYFTVVSRMMTGDGSAGRGSAWVITGTLVWMLATIPFYGLHVPPNIETWLLLLGLATWSTAMPIFVIIIGIQIIGVTTASIISTFEPVLTMILAMILLGESILPVQWVGAALIISGVILLEIRSRRAPAIVEPILTE